MNLRLWPYYNPDPVFCKVLFVCVPTHDIKHDGHVRKRCFHAPILNPVPDSRVGYAGIASLAAATNWAKALVSLTASSAIILRSTWMPAARSPQMS